MQHGAADLNMQRVSNLMSVLQCCLKVNVLTFERLEGALGSHTTACIIKHDDMIESRQDVNFVGYENAGGRCKMPSQTLLKNVLTYMSIDSG